MGKKIGRTINIERNSVPGSVLRGRHLGSRWQLFKTTRKKERKRTRFGDDRYPDLSDVDVFKLSIPLDEHAEMARAGDMTTRRCTRSEDGTQHVNEGGEAFGLWRGPFAESGREEDALERHESRITYVI